MSASRTSSTGAGSAKRHAGSRTTGHTSPSREGQAAETDRMATSTKKRAKARTWTGMTMTNTATLKIGRLLRIVGRSGCPSLDLRFVHTTYPSYAISTW